MKDSTSVILEPIVTEKSNIMREKNKFAFKVALKANKFQVMKAIAELFEVHPVKCNIVNHRGKPKRVRYQAGYTAHWKKAIITLPEGEKIKIFEGA
jgi:large subunit ribosomal protein L23